MHSLLDASTINYSNSSPNKQNDVIKELAGCDSIDTYD